jgi:two-component system KDP operon response regulator KdpE
VKLTRTEWSLLEELSRHPGKLLLHRYLLEQVWGPEYSSDVDVLRVFISQLRRKIEPNPGHPSLIATEQGIGYRWLLQPIDAGDRAAEV